MAGVARAPFGSWRSAIPIGALVAGVARLSEPSLDGDDIYWLEGRPENRGRETLVRRGADGSTEDLSPAEVNVRDRVHEYGGGAYVVDDGVAWYSDFVDGRLFRRERDGSVRPVTAAGPWRYADPIVDRARGRLVCIREDHTDPRAVVNAIVAVPLDGAGEVRILVEGSDFYANPRLSPDGRRLAWLSWEHPNLPWDETSLWVGELLADGAVGERERIAGEPGESVVQPRWSPEGVLHFVAERSGWWNIYRRVDGRDEPVAPAAAEFAHPQWRFRLSSYAFAGDGTILAAARHDARDELLVIDPRTGTHETLAVPYTEIEFVEVSGAVAVFVAGSPTEWQSVVRLDLGDRTRAVLRRATETVIDPRDVSVGRHIEFPTAGGRTAHGLFHPPRNRAYDGPEGELPPLIVTSHGGPTSAASTTLSLFTQILTSRGYAVLDVDYGGSTGYGREYRKRLEGRWGIVDVEDCAHGALALAGQGLVDRERLAIRGASASGFTTLCAITFRNEFKAGVCAYGIGDLETFVVATHKFESHYLDRLIGPYPERRDLYQERSPLNFTERISTPSLILQGLDDRIVPPAQGQQIVDVLRAKRLPCAYLGFATEDHGFRQAASIVRAAEAELSFYAQVFGFEPADSMEALVVENLAPEAPGGADRAVSGAPSRP